MTKPFKNLFFLMFLNGFLLASLFYFKGESAYENGLFNSIKASIDSKLDNNDTQDSIAIKAMNTCNFLMQNRAEMFTNVKSLGVTADLLHPTSVDLMTTRGACGSYSMVLARIFQSFHYPVRIAEMKANGSYGAHNIVEVKTSNTGWIVLDPTFNLSFTRPDGHLANFRDVQADWNYYSKQTPPHYDMTYHYEDVRYTNWEKIPVVMPLIKKILSLFIGKEGADTFSMRTYFLQIYTLYFYLTLLIYIPIFLITIRQFVKTQLFPDQSIPFTVSNLIKYLKERFNAGSVGKMHSL